ncbi:MAG: undecaprenyl-diphosphatase UppP [Chloroflexota bacterium]
MDLLEALTIGVVQGLTEFIPVSSSGHLVIVPWVLGWPEPGLAFDTMVHLGTLVAVLAFFAGDFLALARGWLRSVRTRTLADDDARLAWLLILATIPAGVAGLLFEGWFEEMFSQPGLVGIFLLVTGALLLMAERLGGKNMGLGSLGAITAVVIGCAQALAICPGISRSGATIAAGLSLGLARPAAARFSFLLSAPIILAAGASQLRDLFEVGLGNGQTGVLLIGFIAAATSGYLCIGFLLRYLQGRGLHVFAFYCFVVGLATILLATVG